MRSKQVWLIIALLALGFGVGRLSVSRSLAAGGTLDSPGPPGSTLSYTLPDVYNRLNAGMAGTQSTFTEPTSGPTVGTGHTLNEIMALAPAGDNINGAIPAQMLAGKTYWSLRTDGTWGTQTGTMPDRGKVVHIPGTTTQTVAAGYHSGSGYVVGDADLAAGNVISGVSIFGITGTYPLAPVPKTGQTASYATGDDGYLQRGVAWPNPRYTDNLDGTATDNLTGLIWLKDANCYGGSRWTEATITSTLTLNSGECGLSDGSQEGDWRLPNVRELQSLIDYGQSYLALPGGHPFTSVQSGHYWSSTTFASNTALAWNVRLYDGVVNAGGKTDTNYVWPVRGGQ